MRILSLSLALVVDGEFKFLSILQKFSETEARILRIRKNATDSSYGDTYSRVTRVIFCDDQIIINNLMQPCVTGSLFSRYISTRYSRA